MTSTLALPPRATHAEARSFRLLATVDRDYPGLYGVSVRESIGSGKERQVVAARAQQTQGLLDHVVAAVRASGHRPTALAPHRAAAPLVLDEAAGVRLALTLLATAPLIRGDRIRSVAAGIASMSIEETFYWYAQCVGERGTAGRRAIRTLLSDG
ncbi:hypothetical protein GCM10010411_63720 [Actinomadura fulvescens]|uniref:DUF7680 domain-containing protein n=1 Tax=Actinomadura fulvescens TaxID=46160 RepID=A0ABP6CJM2_9ACTN